jgi:polysaccharide export outer membrane protein
MKKLASRWGFAFFALAASQLMSNCGMDAAQTTKPGVTASASGHMATTDAAQTNPTGARPQTASASEFAGGDATEYRISRQDILQISVFQVNDLNTAVQVAQDGNITLPLVGKIQIAGKTTAESEQIIAGKLRQKYLQSPQVSVSIKTYGKRITISGEVKAPQVLADDGATTLSQAIAHAGGVGEVADSTRIHVARSKDQHVQDELYNLDDIQAGKVTDPMLKGGDIVVVEQSGSKVALKSVKDLLPFAMFATLF